MPKPLPQRTPSFTEERHRGLPPCSFSVELGVLCGSSILAVQYRKVNLKLLTLLTLLVSASAALGQVNTSYYVSPSGNDSNPGTQSAPWRTVQHAADTARAGSTVNVRGAIYEELVSINVSGNASDGFITFRSYPGETAVLDATHFTPSGRQGVLTIHNQSYVRIEGFEIRNFHTAG